MPATPRKVGNITLKTVPVTGLNLGDLTRSPVACDEPHWRGVESITSEGAARRIELAGGRVFRAMADHEVDVLLDAPETLEVATAQTDADTSTRYHIYITDQPDAYRNSNNMAEWSVHELPMTKDELTADLNGDLEATDIEWDRNEVHATITNPNTDERERVTFVLEEQE